MKLKTIFIILLSMITYSMTAQEEIIHYYLKIDGSEIEKFDLELGIVSYDEEYNPTQTPVDNINTLTELNDAICASLGEANTSNNLNVVIHGIWGDYTFAWKEMVRNLTKDVYTTDSGERKVMLSIIWDSSINYLTGVKIARKKGDYLGPFLKELVNCQREETEITFLCHSMGNRIFQHMAISSGLISDGDKVIDHYISAGADLESNIFDEGQPLYELHKIIDKMTIYVHNNDRSLKMSKLVNKNKRLGLNGLDPYRMPENFTIIDVSVITDHTNFITSMSNHRYFYMSPTVIKDVKRLVWEQDYITQKKRLDHPRRLKLMPEVVE